MAGRPKQRAEMVMLDKYADEIFEKLDEGKRQADIAASLGVMRSSLTRWLNANPERKQSLADSRAHAADDLAEESLQIADDTQFAGSAHEVAAAKLRIETRRHLAGVWNRDKYGEQRGALVQVNIGTLHLDALRQAAQAVEAVEARPEAPSLLAGLDSSERDILDVDVTMVEAVPVLGDPFGLM